MALEKEATITKKENMYKHHILIPLFTQRTLMHLLTRFSSSRHLSLLITIKKTKKSDIIVFFVIFVTSFRI